MRELKVDVGSDIVILPRLSWDGRRLFFLRRSEEANLWLVSFT